MRDRLNLYTAPFINVTSYFEMVDLAQKYGIKYLETLNELDFVEPDLEKAKELRAYADKKQVKFCCVSVGINLVGDDRKEKMKKLKKFAEMAVILGSPYLHHTIAVEFTNPENVLKNEEIYFQRGIEAVREIYDYAKQIGVRTIYENQGFIFNGVGGFERFLNTVERDVGVVADMGNIEFVDEKIEDFIPKFADKIVHAHVKDYKIGHGAYTTRHNNHIVDCPLGEGIVNIKRACEELKKIGYCGFVGLECMPVDKSDEKVFLNNIAHMEDCLA